MRFGSLSFSYSLLIKKSMTKSHALGIRIRCIMLILEKFNYNLSKNGFRYAKASDIF